MKRRPLWLRARLLTGSNHSESRLFFEQLRHFEQIWPEVFWEGTAHSKELADRKEAIVYKGLLSLVNRFPSHLDDSFPKGCFRLLALTSDAFFEERPVKHLVRLICSHYFIYKELIRSLRLFPQERHLSFRLMPVRLQFPFGTKFALGIAIGISSLNEYELFGEKHILMSVQQLIPSVNTVQGSFYFNQKPEDQIRLLYIELEKDDGSRFSVEEIRKIKHFLSKTLKTRVEKLLPLLFMTRNEEEVLKTILILGQELRHRRSLPQVVISFESQSQTELFFTAIVVHLVTAPEQSLRKIALNTDECTWTANRIQLVDYLEGRISKEAAVFHVKMKKNASLLRGDFSINFYLARQKIVETLQAVLGPIRDYNGGLIVQQGERLSEFKQEFANEIASYPELAENFFYSLEPIEVQATLGQEYLKRLFNLCLEAIETPLPKRESYFFKAESREAHTFAVVCMRDLTMKDCFSNRLATIGIDEPCIVTSFTFQDHYIFGYIHTSSTFYSPQQFISLIQEAIGEGLKKISSLSTLRLAFPSLPVSLDPRIGGDGAYSAMIVKMLFEGLMKYGNDGKLTYGLCESVDISPDAKQYTFHLRKSIWSNGVPVTADDFIYAWKKILSPDFHTPYAYLFYPIKYAKLVKDGKRSPDILGVQAIDDHTLVVELEHPTPSFLEYTSLSLYSPVPHFLHTVQSNWAHQAGKEYVCNGPFELAKRSQPQGLIELAKNPLYWDPQPNQPDQVLIIQSNAQTALQMFKDNEIDWCGNPLQTWTPHLFANCNEHTESMDSAGTLWGVFNVERFPFHNIKLRQAFSYAINRKELVKELAYDGLPAFSPLPIMHSQKPDIIIPDADEKKALQLFQEALQELGITKEEFPRLSCMLREEDIFVNRVTESVMARWANLFGIRCEAKQYHWHVIFDRLLHGDFQISFPYWKAWVNDPLYTLNSFRHKFERMNLSRWENALFQGCLDMVDQTTEPKKRAEYLAKAESILIQEVPVLPLLHDRQQFIKKNYVHLPVPENVGIFDFRAVQVHKNVPNISFK